MLSLFTKRRGGTPHAFLVAMSGVQMGDRLLHIGCTDASQLAAIASKVGLSGRAAAVVSRDAEVTRIAKAAAQAGVLVEGEVVVPPGRLPYPDGEFDIVIVDNLAGQIAAMDPARRGAILDEALRVLRPAGRVMVISTGSPHGIRALIGGARPATEAFEPGPLLKEHGFGTARVLADQEGLVFVEALKPRK